MLESGSNNLLALYIYFGTIIKTLKHTNFFKKIPKISNELYYYFRNTNNND